MIRKARAALEGREIAYWHGGSGMPLLLLQGGMADARLHWEPLWKRLLPHYEVFAPDLPGFGESSALEFVSYEALLNWTVDFHFGVIGERKVIAIGNSLGATLARLYAAQKGFDTLSQSVLINGGRVVGVDDRTKKILRWPVAEMAVRLRSRMGLSKKQIASLFHDHSTPSYRSFISARRNGYVYVLMREMLCSPLPELVEPSTPTLILWGERDELSPIEQGVRLAQELPRAHFMSLKNAGHLPQVEQPEAVASRIIGHIRNRA